VPSSASLPLVIVFLSATPCFALLGASSDERFEFERTYRFLLRFSLAPGRDIEEVVIHAGWY
jgi:hypothetical protein